LYDFPIPHALLTALIERAGIEFESQRAAFCEEAIAILRTRLPPAPHIEIRLSVTGPIFTGPALPPPSILRRRWVKQSIGFRITYSANISKE
jgi:hypothetical protein